jgi:hypothetical protein
LTKHFVAILRYCNFGEQNIKGWKVEEKLIGRRWRFFSLQKKKKKEDEEERSVLLQQIERVFSNFNMKWMDLVT